MKVKYTIASFLILLLILIGCTNNQLTLHRDISFDVGFNTPFSFMLFTKSEEEFKDHFENAKTLARKYNAYFDIYNDYEGVNNLKTINDNAGIRPIKVDQDIIDLLLEAQQWSEKTHYLFDPTLGAVLKVWHDAREYGMELNQEGKFGPSPTLKELKEAEQFVGFEYLEIDKKNSTVYLNHPQASLDVGAIAKGWAVEKIAQALENDGIEYGIVNGGGNVRLIGGKASEGSWSVGVTNPDALDEDSLISLSFDQSMSVVTSGDYERYFIDDQGRQQNHLINPKTLQPTRISRSVTITTLDSGVADILSTCFSMVTLEEAAIIEQELNIDDLGIIFVKDQKETNNAGYLYEEINGKHVYYIEEISKHINK